jgi:Tfp pilus assembly PilM family ATPase
MIDSIRKMDLAKKLRDLKVKSDRCLGLEFDHHGVRALRIVKTLQDREIQYQLEGIHAEEGDFSKEEDLVECLRSLKEKLDIMPRERIVNCITGRHVYVAQMPFRKLPAAQLKEALKLELRKVLTFDTSKSILEYQLTTNRAGDSAKHIAVLVSVVSMDLVEKQMRILGKAGIKPTIMDVFPYAVANAFWAGEVEGDPSAAHVVIHMSPDVYTVVFEGDEVPFYSRSIYLAARPAALKQMPGAPTPKAPDRQRQLMAFNEELKRTISYYKTTYQIGNISDLYLVGDPDQIESFLDSDRARIGVPARESTLHKRFGAPPGWQPGKFDVAAALALRH